ncbi:MAG: alkane 1-monooxygenase [Pseudomonadota bacterium]
MERTAPLNWQAALPFWLSLALIPLAWISATQGGWWVLLLPFSTWYLFSIIDHFVGLNEGNADPDTPRAQLRWYRAITLIWPPVQFFTLYGVMYYTVQSTHLGFWEQLGLFVGVGVITGTVGINYSHELMHQRSKLERWWADILLAMVLYSHFRSEHLLVHHRYVGTPKDPVTARLGEGFYRFFGRVLRQSFVSAVKAETAMLARKDRPWWDTGNPFWRYGALQLAFVVLAALIGGWQGVGLFAFQAFVAIWQLEIVNYVEHYGLTRKHLGDGKYEPVRPRHSWNAAHRASNWLLINLQRHSDHHYKPDRPFPLLQNYGDSDAPQLPFGYPVMTLIAISPSLFRSMMNPRVQKWRSMYYPEIADWTAYNKRTTPVPR